MVRFLSFVFVIEIAMAEAFVFGIGDLFAELFAHALGVLCPLQAAGAVTPGTGKTFLYGADDFLIRI